MKAIIIEDETAAVRSLRAILEQNRVLPVEVVAELESAKDSIDYLSSNPQPDLIFMDIHLADGSAFRIFEQVEVNAPVIFTTAYDEYALQAFQVSSIDYLLKPVSPADLERALNKFRLFSPDERERHILLTNQIIQNRHIVKSLLIHLLHRPRKGDGLYRRRPPAPRRPYPRPTGRTARYTRFLSCQPPVHHRPQSD